MTLDPPLVYVVAAVGAQVHLYRDNQAQLEDELMDCESGLLPYRRGECDGCRCG
jgi:hypothetical protein